MAGTIIADFIRTDANQLSLNVGNTTFATINASGFFSNTGTQLIAANGKISGASVISGSITSAAFATAANTIPRSSMTSGAVLQVATSTLSTDFSTTSISYVDSGLSVSVTPTSSSSRFLLLANMSMTGGAGGVVIFYQFVRNSTAVGIGTQAGASNAVTGGVYNDPGVGSGSHNALFMYTNANYIDSPATTSAVTYKIQVRNNTAGTAVYLNRRNDSYITAISTLTVMEIAG